MCAATGLVPGSEDAEELLTSRATNRSTPCAGGLTGGGAASVTCPFTFRDFPGSVTPG